MPAVRSRRETRDALEEATEEGGFLVSDLPTDLIYRGFRSLEAALGVLDPKALHVGDRTQARRACEPTLEGALCEPSSPDPGTGYDLICFFDCMHDMGDPAAAAAHAAKTIAHDGTVMLVEPFANDRVEDNISPVARMYYAASTTICCAHAISEGGHMVLGAQAGEARLADVFRKAGFTRFRRAFETPFNLVLEARL